MANDLEETNENPLTRPPLGLPEGSVRALLTLLVLAVVVVETLRGNTRLLEGLWSETLLIALAHYFTTRRMINLPRALRQKLEAEGHLGRESHPLFLPRHSIRLILVGTLAGLTWYITREVDDRQDLQKIPTLLIIVWSYLLGVLVRGILSWMNHGRRPSGLWGDLRAAAVLLLMLATAIPYFLGKGDLVPEALRNTTLACVLFYFGTR